ncbi:SDR family NAD(P)-dependent oxidoreductase [Blastococcus sp. CT_GayMR20]|uniref:SDR family NAD(P)-dependent oxidoreductase n=1 Tax=Blastococcus sp. CT_GayMR20 TaxID=2559609 RepID=UPI001073700D|nr:SDR family NAD(P)-dependent oxidoreductase [Blastococcus sp. CT_GayMR20]TFV90197.1 SDR family NAD(P)-dependent oxidoreductase [Blastococcus sp. CT_GayMR20]TFV90198.1 SDR family NAD(P)-dependent oxidoreductase [Blastococcus sp. CT_GayMR20]
MAWTEKDIPDLSGRTAVVTGANGGLGYQTALALAGAGAHVVLAARDPGKTTAAVARIAERYPAASLGVVPLDLGDLSVVSTAASKVLAAHEQVDLLVNNAGVMAMPQRTTVDGFEMQLGVDHLGHWAFTAHLLPALLKAPAARVVTVTSTARFRSQGLDPADPHMRENYGAWSSYARAKMANYHFGLGLQQQFERARVRAASLIAHPGLTNTDLQPRSVREGGAGWLGAFFETMTARSGMTPLEGARPQLRAATDPPAKGGELYAPQFGTHGPAVKRPILRRFNLQKQIDVLWQVSERETGIPLEVAVPEPGAPRS